MNKLTIVAVTLLLCTSLCFAAPLSTAAVQPTGDQVASVLRTANQPAQDSPPPVTPTKEIVSPSLQAAVDKFFRELSAQKGFEGWKQGTWSSYALGPGTHGWVILITVGGKEAGYMVLHAAGPDTYRLSEYGKGEFPLYSLQTLYRSLVQLELMDYSYQAQRLYYDPLQAVWKITVDGADREWYLDAKTGEELPFKDSSHFPDLPATEDMKPFTNTDSSHTIAATGQTTAAAASQRLPWVQGKPEANMTQAKLKQWINDSTTSQPIYSAELFQGSVTLPLTVTGYQAWSGGDLFVQVLQDDDRYLPYEPLAALGGFYP
ncbi:hypothetical protein [Paenibacillus cremeus]|uniref:Uncharacterized protein n=1 Tax=Paenibacillus cremeus TaxID=2163881 RepID=A0A559K856_9BACL|nr:hypothetical protein [Paenibacillus cremeus]TVY08308.1 hypothetical protein FPZ49_19805 [Paenibacillus cremeus]